MYHNIFARKFQNFAAFFLTLGAQSTKSTCFRAKFGCNQCSSYATRMRVIATSPFSVPTSPSNYQNMIWSAFQWSEKHADIFGWQALYDFLLVFHGDLRSRWNWSQLYACIHMIHQPLCENMTSSTKPEVHKISQRRQRWSEPRLQATCIKLREVGYVPWFFLRPGAI